jgi:hypothetical protein
MQYKIYGILGMARMGTIGQCIHLICVAELQLQPFQHSNALSTANLKPAAAAVLQLHCCHSTWGCLCCRDLPPFISHQPTLEFVIELSIVMKSESGFLSQFQWFRELPHD